MRALGIQPLSSIMSITAITKHLLLQPYNPLKFVMTYKFSQDHIELLFNKIRRRCGWNNNPNVLQCKYALRSILIRNSIEPSRTGNCTNFDDALCDSTEYLDFSSKRKEHVPHATNVQYDAEMQSAERMMIYMDYQSPNLLKDSVLDYIAGHIV